MTSKMNKILDLFLLAIIAVGSVCGLRDLD